MKSNRIQRVFRDKEEFLLTSNLEDYIVQALQQSNISGDMYPKIKRVYVV